MEYTHIRQPFEPVYDRNSEILILGSLPSVKSRENGFYYGHPKNRFWKVMAAIMGVQEPVTVEEKKNLLLRSHVAVWDVIEECDIKGSSDSSIRNAIPADIPALLKKTGIQRIFANGKTAATLYHRLIEPLTGEKIVDLPSTSPANAAFSLERLIEIWGAAIKQEETDQKSGYMDYEVRITIDDYRQFMQQAHFGKNDMETCLEVWTDLYGTKERKAGAKVRAWYCREGLPDKITVVMTIGKTYDEMISHYEARGELLKAYAVECLAMGILRNAYSLFGDQIYEREGKYPGELLFLEEEQMKRVPKLLEQMNIQEVQCNEALALTPQKTVVFITELSDVKKVNCGNICATCKRYSCPNRQHVYQYGYQRILANRENDLWKRE